MSKGKRIRKIVGWVLLALSLILTADIVAVAVRRISSVVRASVYTEIFIYESVICLAFILVSLDVLTGFFTKAKNVILRSVGWLLRVVCYILAVASLVFGIMISSYGISSDRLPEDGYILTLGMASEDGRMPKDLVRRLDKAISIYEDNKLKVIAAGGNPGENGITEAEMMERYLAENGIPAADIIKEDKSEDTGENLSKAAVITGKDSYIVLVTNGCHMRRAVREAGKAGFENVFRSPAPSGVFEYPANLMWEVVLEFRYIIFGK